MLSEKARALVAEHGHLVYRKAWEGVGVFGLIRAAQTYDSRRGIPFAKWAYPRICSAAADELSQTGGMRGCATHGRYKRRRFSAGLAEAIALRDHHALAGGDSVLETVLRQEIIEILKMNLPADDWLFLADYYYRCHGESARMARLHGMGTSAIGHRRQRVLRKCRTLLRGYGYTCRTMDCRSRLSRPFICEQTGEQFWTLRQAADRLGVQKSNVLRILQGRRRFTRGYSFRYDSNDRIELVA